MKTVRRFKVVKPIRYQQGIGNAEVGDIAVKEGGSYRVNGIGYRAEDVENDSKYFEEIEPLIINDEGEEKCPMCGK